jgi:hydroxysqualene dehydroxylase
MPQGKVYLVGAGLAGLSAAVTLADAGVAVELIEAAGQAGGRCRSYFDPALNQVIDNGNHLILSGNRAVYSYLRTIGAEDRLAGPAHATFDFADARTGERWALKPNEGAIPWWIFSTARRVPHTRATDYRAVAELMLTSTDRPVSDVTTCEGALWERLLQPFLLAALNTEAKAGSSALAAAVIRETLAKSGGCYRPRIASPTLAAAFIEPALAFLKQRGAEVKLNQRLRALELNNNCAKSFMVQERNIVLHPNDLMILATPPWVTADLLPGIEVPDEFRAIVNGHFKAAPLADAPAMLGVIGGTVEWIFAFEDRIAVTVSGADWLVDRDREALAQLLWADVAKLYGISTELPPWQIVKEKRATFAATPEQNARRPPSRTRWQNVFLAGDWVQTGLPATIEGAIRSGQTAAQLALARMAV